MMASQSEAQREATKKWQYIGTRIRQLCCLDSIASRYLNQDQQKVIRDIVDSELNKMGYESLTARNKRWQSYVYEDFEKLSLSTYKFQKLEG